MDTDAVSHGKRATSEADAVSHGKRATAGMDIVAHGDSATSFPCSGEIDGCSSVISLTAVVLG